jgi:hypothetical protein
MQTLSEARRLTGGLGCFETSKPVEKFLHTHIAAVECDTRRPAPDCPRIDGAEPRGRRCRPVQISNNYCSPMAMGRAVRACTPSADVKHDVKQTWYSSVDID